MSQNIPDPHAYLAGYGQKLQAMQQQAQQAKAAFDDARTEATSPDSAVRVVVAAGGRIESLKLSPRAMDLSHVDLANKIIATIRTAQVDAARLVEESMRPLLGDGEGMSFLREQLDQSIARIDPANETEQAERGGPSYSFENDDDDFGGSVYGR